MDVKAKHLNGVIAGLLALWEVTESIHAHVLEPVIRKKLQSPYKEEASKILKWLRRYGLARKKGGTDSWAITKRGKDFLKEQGFDLA
ncbi:hypothetical protein JXL21_05340 [Candidatus Bathyarchaeota archaeon]|nr:hypothetical protein [Candidatus Bathyarchaeota archaeon]